MESTRNAKVTETWKKRLKSASLVRLVYEKGRPEDRPSKAWYAYIKEVWLSAKFGR